jgi:DNA-binding beta-propeller fold protein YncE
VRFDGKTLEQIAGGERGFAGDGGPAKDAQFNGPQEIATDGPDVYVMDIYNHRLRHIDGAGVIDSVAGTYDGVGEMTVGERRKANQVPIDPTGLTVDPQHRPLWCTRHGQIQRLAADGMVEWVAGLTGSGGTGGLDDIVGLIGSSGDQPVDQVKLLIPRGLRVGPDGAIYVAEFGGLRIARIADGKVSTFAGLPRAAAIAALGDPSRAEDGLKATAAALAFPGDLCFDKAGNMYVTEIGTTGLSLFTALGGEGLSLGDALPPAPPRVRRIAPDGTITTICGKGGKFFPDPDAEDALVLPTGLAIAPDGRMVIVDTGANQIIILPAGSY